MKDGREGKEGRKLSEGWQRRSSQPIVLLLVVVNNGGWGKYIERRGNRIKVASACSLSLFLSSYLILPLPSFTTSLLQKNVFRPSQSSPPKSPNSSLCFSCPSRFRASVLSLVVGRKKEERTQDYIKYYRYIVLLWIGTKIGLLWIG